MVALAVAGRADVLDGDWFVAVRAWASGADGGHERAAVLAALAAERSESAAAAFVDGEVPLAAGGRDGRDRRGRGAAASPGGLLARGRAPAAAAGRGERLPACGAAAHRNAIVTPRGCRVGGPGVATDLAAGLPALGHVEVEAGRGGELGAVAEVAGQPVQHELLVAGVG